VRVLPAFLLILICALVPAPFISAAEPDSAGVKFFESKIRPVLVDHCFACHSAAAKEVKGGLLLDSKVGVLKGGTKGPVVVPGHPDQSRLVKALHHDGALKMPPDGKLPDAVIKDFTVWIEMGAPDPRDGTAVAKGIDWGAARQFWSFQAVRKPGLPTVKDSNWPANEIDRFVLARLEEIGLRPTSPADKRALIRRATFDLIGLPPTPEEIDAFLNDNAPNAFAKVVDRLLDSPHYGERWGRYWLDVARYAEDQAHTFAVKPFSEAWRYRDWVIEAFNSDMPYDRFVKLQIAADLMDDGSPDFIRQRAALGYFGLGAIYYKDNSCGPKAVADELDDRIDTLGRGFLGLTIACARCHDHKFDPIPTQDYYSLAGVFASSQLTSVSLAPKDVVERFQESQKQVLEAERKVKEFMAAEKMRLASAHAGEIDAYMTAVRKLELERIDHPNYSVAEAAKKDKLHAAILDRWLKFLDPKSKSSQGLAALDTWRKLPAPKRGAAEPTKDAEQAAQAFQQLVVATLAKPWKETQAEKPKVDLLQSLFGEKGVFAITDGEMMKELPGDKKKQMETMKTDWERLKKTAPPAPPSAHGMAEAAAADMKIYLRGDPKQQGDVAPRRFLHILAGNDPPRFTHGSGRLELAEAIANKSNPLTARVFVNRIWQQHFGRGIVGTPSNFGHLGARPTHPELLDYLAALFMENNWSIKKLHREIMLSRTYQQSASVVESSSNPKSEDPDNLLLGHMNRRRLDVEAWRDALLAVSGQLDGSFGGPTIDLGSDQNRRRTVYAKVSRHELNNLLRLFDFPDANITSERRTETTVPQQQLFVMNSPFFIARAKALAARLISETSDEAARIRRAYVLAYGRRATNDELALATKFLAGKDSADEAQKNQLSRWERYIQALLAANEFLYVD
jgi:hypothetical protein